MNGSTFLAGLVILSATLVSGAQTPAGKAPAKPVDTGLENALQHPSHYMFGEQVTFKTSVTEPHTFDLIISSANDPLYGGKGVTVRPGTMRIFRADASVDDFTKKGGFYWKCGKTEGKAEFKTPGSIIMVVRDMDGTVRCYTMVPDYRC